MIPAFPLQWPVGWKRFTSSSRTDARFSKGERQYRSSEAGGSYVQQRSLSIADGVARVVKELERLGVSRDDMVISTNAPLRLDGFPRSDASNPTDPGAAVYWRDIGQPRVMAIDRYVRLADNLAAIAATLEALRSIERHGGAVILERAFTGFTALPSPGAVRTWREVLGISAAATPTAASINARFRELAIDRHPDRGGSHAAMTELNAARDEALRAVGHIQ